MASDQRRDPRFDTDVPVQLQGGEIEGSLRNVSVSGAAIEFVPEFVLGLGKTQVMFEIGDSVDLRAEITPDSHAATRGVVVRRDANGIAVKFDQPEEDLLAEIVSAVRKVIERDAS